MSRSTSPSLSSSPSSSVVAPEGSGLAVDTLQSLGRDVNFAVEESDTSSDSPISTSAVSLSASESFVSVVRRCGVSFLEEETRATEKCSISFYAKSLEDLHQFRRFLVNDIKKDRELSSRIGEKKIRIHGSYIAFDDKTLRDAWLARYPVAMNEQRKKIVILGSGDVAGETFKAVCHYHEDNRVGVEVVVINSRNPSHAEGIVRDIRVSNFCQVRASGDPAQITGADVVVLAAGVRAGKINASNRADSFVYNIEPIRKYGDEIDRYAKDDALVLVVTNPVELTSALLRSRLNPKKNRVVVGSGNALDSMRYRQLLRQQLRSTYSIEGEVEDVFVVGMHDRNSMVFIKDQASIGGRKFSELVESNIIAQEELDKVFAEVERQVKEEGLVISHLKTDRRGASVMPAISVWEVAREFLYGKEHEDERGFITTAAIFLNQETRKSFGIDCRECFLGVPLEIKKGKILPHNLTLSSQVKDELTAVGRLIAEHPKLTLALSLETGEAMYRDSIRANLNLVEQEDSKINSKNNIINAANIILKSVKRCSIKQDEDIDELSQIYSSTIVTSIDGSSQDRFLFRVSNEACRVVEDDFLRALGGVINRTKSDDGQNVFSPESIRIVEESFGRDGIQKCLSVDRGVVISIFSSKLNSLKQRSEETDKSRGI